MTKYIKRIGTKAYKFATELHIEKVQLDVPLESRIMVAFKRGPHKIESKSFPSLENGVAIFDETLMMHSTLYFDKKKNAYLSKEATLIVFTVSVKGSKVAGHVKFDLAELPNSNLKERRYSWPILECADSQAVIQVTVRNLQTEELSRKHVDSISDEEAKPVPRANNHTVSSSKEQRSQILSRSPGSNGVQNESSLNKSNSSSERNQKDLKFSHSTPTVDNSSLEQHKQPLSTHTQTEVKSVSSGLEDAQYKNVSKNTRDMSKEHHHRGEEESASDTTTVIESQTQKSVPRLGEFELKDKNVEREKRELVQKIKELDFEVVNARVTVLQKENAVLAKKKKELEERLQNTDLKEFESRVAEYERMITILKEERNALDKGDRPSVLEFEKMKRNLTETEFMINYLKNEKRQSEDAMTGKIVELQSENQELRAQNESIKKQLQEVRAAFEEKYQENSQLRQEISRIALENINANKSGEAEAMQIALLEAHKAISKMANQKERADKDHRSLIDQMQRENNAYKIQIQGLSSINIENLKKNSKESDSVLERLRRENEALQQKFEDQIANLVKEKQELELFLKDSQTEDTQHLSFESIGYIANTQKRNDEQQEEVEKLRRKIRNLEGQNQNLLKEKQESSIKKSEHENMNKALYQKVEERGIKQKNAMGQRLLSSDKPDRDEDEVAELQRKFLSEKADLEKQIRELTLERDELKKALMQQLESAAKEKEENIEQLNDVMQQLEDKGRELKKLTLELEKKTLDLLTERKKAQIAESIGIQEIKNKLKEQSDREKELNYVVKELNDKIVQLERHIEELESQNQALTDQIETAKIQNEELVHQQKEVEKENQGYKKEVAELKNQVEQIEALESQISRLQSELQVAEESSTQRTSEFEESLEELKKKNNDLKNKLALKNDQIEKLEEEVNKMRQELEEKSRIQETDQFGTARVEEYSSEYEKSGVDDEANASDLRHENSILRMENETLKELYEKAMQGTQTKRPKEKVVSSGNRADLDDELQKAGEMIAGQTKELEDLKAQIEDSKVVKAENAELHTRVQTLEYSIEELNAKIAKLEKIISDNAEELLTLQEQSSKSSQRVNREKQQLTQKIEALNQTIAEYTAQEEDWAKRLKIFEAAKSKVEGHYLKLQGEYNSLKNDWMEAEQQKSKLTADIRILQEKEVELTSKLTDMAKELLNAKTEIGEIINIVFEFGTVDVVDIIETRVLNKASKTPDD